MGVGQSEIEIAAVADPTVAILNPGAGDAIQAAKAGLLEIADIIVVNKADRDGADQTARDLHIETGLPILKIIASQNARYRRAGRRHRRPSPRRYRRATRQSVRGCRSCRWPRVRCSPILVSQNWPGGVADGDLDVYAATARLLEVRRSNLDENSGFHFDKCYCTNSSIAFFYR